METKVYKFRPELTVLLIVLAELTVLEHAKQ